MRFRSSEIKTRRGRRTVAGSVLLARDKGFRVEKAAVSTSSNLIDDIRFKVNVEGTGNVFSGRSL